MKFSELEQVSSQLSCCKEGSCIFFATCFCLLTVLLIFMLPERGHPVARAKEIATVSLRVFRHPAVCACGSLSGFFCVPVRWARCLDRFSAGYALWSMYTCLPVMSFSCVQWVPAWLRLLWLGGPLLFLACSIYLLSLRSYLMIYGASIFHTKNK